MNETNDLAPDNMMQKMYNFQHLTQNQSCKNLLLCNSCVVVVIYTFSDA